VASPVAPGPHEPERIGFLGPEGTFCEQALLTQDDLKGAELVPYDTIPDTLAATVSGAVELGFVPIENSIEGTVNVTLDVLAFEADLLIQREVVLGIQMGLLATPGVALDDIKTVVSFPVASAQCRGFLARELPDVVVEASNSTAEAAQILGKSRDPHTAAIGPLLAGEVYGLDVLASDIEDHPENATRFVAVAREGIPAPTGHDKTSIVVFQRANAPGTLLAILQEFAARGIDLNKLESRPTKQGLGEYCFILDMDGHIADEIVADCLRELQLAKADVKLLGSYPAAGEHAPKARRDAEAAWREADAWIQSLRNQIRS
jgi:prephenate dehydratase